jgi:hypothetical protein
MDEDLLDLALLLFKGAREIENLPNYVIIR